MWYNTCMKITSTTAVRSASKDILARAMAEENITVIHDADAPSAYFDTKRRVLGLPVWKDLTNDMYDMLIGHEVSHALNTPQGTEWADASNRVAGGNDHSGAGRHYLNVVEDARIERLIKIKFPGLRRDFISAYQKFAERDIFGIAGKDLNDLMLIDRLNLHYKIGNIVEIPFSKAERVWIDRIDAANDWNSIVDIATDLYDVHAEDHPQPEQPAEDGEGVEMPGDDSDVDGPSGAGAPSDDDSEDGEDGESGNGSEDGDEDEDGDESGESGNGNESEDGDESGAGMEDDTDDGASAESNDADASTSGTEGAVEGSCKPAPMVPETAEAFEDGLNDMRDDQSRQDYQRVPDLDLDHIIVDYKTIADDMRLWFTGQKEMIENFERCRNEVVQFETACRKTTNMLVKQFEMKMAADQDKRTSVSKTGILDTNTMINYRWSEDIFLRNEEIADGKNHGLVMFIDWSGSMQDCIRQTVEQLLSLVFFCKKVNIPFEVYSFTSNVRIGGPRSRHDYHGDDYTVKYDEFLTGFQKQRDSDGSITDYQCHAFNLNNYLSSRMNAREFKNGIALLWYIMNGTEYGNGCYTPHEHDLGGTPLNEAIFAAADIVNEFKTRNGIQIVNTIVLTDGEASGGGSWGQNHLIDPKTKKTFLVRGRRYTDACVEWLQDVTGANVIGFYLTNSIKNMRYSFGDIDFEDAKKRWNKDHFVSHPKCGWTEYFIMKSSQRVDNNAMESLAQDASFTKLKNAFCKATSHRTTSRVLLSRFIDLIAA